MLQTIYSILSILLCIIAMISALLSLLCIFAALKALHRKIPPGCKAVPPMTRLKRWFVGSYLFYMFFCGLFLLIAVYSGFLGEYLSKLAESARAPRAIHKEILTPGADSEGTGKQQISEPSTPANADKPSH